MCRNLQLRKEKEFRRLEDEASEEVAAYRARLAKEVAEEKRRVWLGMKGGRDGGQEKVEIGHFHVTIF